MFVGVVTAVPLVGIHFRISQQKPENLSMTLSGGQVCWCAVILVHHIGANKLEEENHHVYLPVVCRLVEECAASVPSPDSRTSVLHQLLHLLEIS